MCRTVGKAGHLDNVRQSVPVAPGLGGGPVRELLLGQVLDGGAPLAAQEPQLAHAPQAGARGEAGDLGLLGGAGAGCRLLLVWWRCRLGWVGPNRLWLAQQLRLLHGSGLAGSLLCVAGLLLGSLGLLGRALGQDLSGRLHGGLRSGPSLAYGPAVAWLCWGPGHCGSQGRRQQC